VTDPTVIWRKLTIKFARAVTFPDQTPVVMEVVVYPLAEASSPLAGATFVHPQGVQKIVLARDTEVVFELIPSHLAGLNHELLYRIQWRSGGITGRTYSYDFAMPDQDVDFHDLADLGNIIDGEVYLRQQDLGVPGRVARLNADGHVVDAAGQVLATTGAVNAVSSALNAERVARQQAIANLNTSLRTYTDTQVSSLADSAAANLANAVGALNMSINNERSARISNDNALGERIDGLQADLDGLTDTVAGHTATLAAKADLDEHGKVPLAQIPDAARTTGVPVPSLEAMLALTPEQVQQWDIAYGPHGVYALIGTDPSNIDHWYQLNKVSSVNGYDGDVVLDLDDVAAHGGSIAISQVDGLAEALANAGDVEAIAALDQRISAIETDETLVRTVGGVISHTLLDDRVAYINEDGKVVNKDGQIIVVPGSGSVTEVNGQDGIVVLDLSDVAAQGGSIALSQVDGLVDELAAKVDADDPRLADARTPTAHAASHAADGSDPLTLTVGQIDGLDAILANNGLSPTSAHEARIAALENASLNEIQAIVVDATAGTYTLAFGSETTDPIAHDADEDAIAAALAALEGIGAGGVVVRRDEDHSGPGVRYLVEFTGALSVTNVDTLVADTTDLTGDVSVEVVQNGGGGQGGTTRAAWWLGTDTFADVEDPADFALVHGVQLRSPFTVDALGRYHYNPSGVAPPGHTYVYPAVTPGGHLQLVAWDETNPPDPDYALASDVVSLAGTVAAKADAADLQALQLTVADKADQVALEALAGTVADKADQSDLQALQLTVAAKADADDLADLAQAVAAKADADDLAEARDAIAALQVGKADLGQGGTVPIEQVPQLPVSHVEGLAPALASKADLDGGVLKLTQVPSGIPTSKVDGLDAALAARPTLNGAGKLSASVLPPVALTTVKVVANKAAMLALTSNDVQPGDIVVITATSDRGNYILADADPGVFDNWVKLVAPEGNVSSVNGQTGEVVLTASDVGARSVGDPIDMSDVSGLQNALDLKASVAALNSGLATKTSPADVQAMMSAAVPVKLVAARVATTAVASLSGAQSIDGALVGPGTTVLLTAQASSVNNGLWVVNAGAWTRPADFANGSYFLRGSIVIVTDGAVNANTIWQQTAASGVVGTTNNNWSRIGYVAPPFVPNAGNGIEISGGNTFTVKGSTGISVSGNGVAIDTTTVARKATGIVPSGSTTATLIHNLNTNAPIVQIIEVASGNLVSAGVTLAGVNAVSVEFATPPLTNQYRWVVIG